ncbi:MAG: LysR family transcriptional regulator [Eubacterium sp.]|nr:LysR family transcriptional regulator [Eubacterium sp.]
MDIKVLESFIIVAEQSSFTKASDILGYSQSAISTQIRQLEKYIGTPLFERVHHSVRLTAKGQEVLKLSHEILKLSKDMQKVAEPVEVLSGTVRIAMAESLCHRLFWDNYTVFHNKYPGIHLKVISTQTEEMFELARRNEVDIIYTLDKHIYEKSFVTVEDRIIETHFVASSRNSLCQKNNVSLIELMNHPLILTEEGMSYRQLLEEELSKLHLSLHPFLEIGDTDLILHLVRQNLGIGFLPDYVTEADVDSGEIVRLNVDNQNFEVWTQLLYHKDKWCSPEMICVMDFLKDIFL